MLALVKINVLFHSLHLARAINENDTTTLCQGSIQCSYIRKFDCSFRDNKLVGFINNCSTCSSIAVKTAPVMPELYLHASEQKFALMDLRSGMLHPSKQLLKIAPVCGKTCVTSICPHFLRYTHWKRW